MAINSVSHQFVELMPEKFEERILYVSVQYATAIHLCCCGCKNKVVTPLTPKDSKLIFDGETVSLYPSIGNWNFNASRTTGFAKEKWVGPRAGARRKSSPIELKIKIEKAELNLQKTNHQSSQKKRAFGISSLANGDS